MSQRILLVDDDPSQIRVLSRMLAGLGELHFSTSGEAALAMARQTPLDLILLDAEMPDMSGFEVCELLKADATLADVPVIFVTSHAASAFEIAGFEIGAADFIAKPVDAPIVLARVRTQLRLKRLSDELRRIATVDPLTGVANRRRLDDCLALEWGRARRSGAALSMLMIDVDHFKSFNDHHGHVSGDACLQSIGRMLAGLCRRPADLVARFGGEEFVVLLPDTGRAGASHLAATVLDAMEHLAIVHSASPTAPHVTVSVGVACYDEASACWAVTPSDSQFIADLAGRFGAVDLVRAADQALYVAKSAGRAQAQLLDLADVDAHRTDPLPVAANRARLSEQDVHRTH